MSATTITPTKPDAAKRKGSKVSRKITRVILPRSVITSAAQFVSTDGALFSKFKTAVSEFKLKFS